MRHTHVHNKKNALAMHGTDADGSRYLGFLCFNCARESHEKGERIRFPVGVATDAVCLVCKCPVDWELNDPQLR